MGLRTTTLLFVFLFSVVGFAEYEAVPGEYLVKIKTKNKISLMTAKHLAIALSGELKEVIGKQILVIKRSEIETQESAIESLLDTDLIEIAEPNYIYHATKAPNDFYFGDLWGMKNDGQLDGPKGQSGTPGMDIDVAKAWDIETGSSDTVIAVIDTGIDYNHVDIKPNMWRNEAEANGQTGVDDDGNGYIDDIYGMSFADAGEKADPMDDHGHGTHCAGTIGAKGGNREGVVGVNWTTKLMAIKFLNAQGSGSLNDAIKAIDYAIKMKAKIISNSWGGGGPSELLKEAIQRSNNAGALFVAAAGNNSSNTDLDPHYPSSYDVDNILAVAAIDNKGNLASFSNYGKVRVHVAAPGNKILSTNNMSDPKFPYAYKSGTSMAAPHVSGIAGLVLSHEPHLTNLQLKQRIIDTAKPLRTLRNKVATGGLANAYHALTGEIFPPDANDPSNWQTTPYTFSSPHPYANKTETTFEINVPGAKEIAIYFSKFDTETAYDTVKLYDRNGKEIMVLSSNNDDIFSDPVPGDYIKVVFKTDETVERYGFDITKLAFR